MNNQHQNPQIVGELITLFRLGQAIAPDIFTVTIRDGEPKSLWLFDDCIFVLARPDSPLNLSEQWDGIVLSHTLNLIKKQGVHFSLQPAGAAYVAIVGSHVRQSPQPAIALLWAYLNWLELSAGVLCRDRDTIAG